MAILTVARKFGSGGREIGRAAAQLMDYQYVDRKRILEDMREAGRQWEERAKYYDENYPDIWERYEWSFRGFVALNQSYFLDYALKDKVVIMGRGGNFLLHGVPHALRIRIVAPLEKRIEKVMEREGVNSENALLLVEKADHEMSRAIYLIYGKGWDNPSEYDKVFDTAVQSAEEIILWIKDALLQREKYGTEKARNILQLRVLAAKIKAEVAINPRFSISVLEVRPKEEGLMEQGLILQGIIHNQSDIKQIEEIARKVVGNVPIECHLQYRWYPRLGSLQFR